MRIWVYPCLLISMFAGPCPDATPGASARVGKPCKVLVINQVPEDLMTHWVDFGGDEREGGFLYTDAQEEHSSFEGHKFRFRTLNGVLVHEYVVPKCPSGGITVHVQPCDSLSPKPDDNSWYDKRWDESFSKLILPTQCNTSLPTSQWSCIRKLTEENVTTREEGAYGFLPHETRGVRSPYQVKDDGYVEHVPQIPHLTPQAYLIMWQPEPMRRILEEFYKDHQDEVKVHEPIAGMYSNVHSVHMSKLDLDAFPDVRSKIVREMQKVLEWWTHLRLRHTSTFGIRIYHNNSMLINHVDRHDTHLASAVIQVGQEAEEGWPLELLGATGTPIEAFLQPGQMVLYEGARVFHGRPMRFKGKSFANLFSHFAPAGYGGLGAGEKFDYRFRTGDAKVGWPRIPVGGKTDDSEICIDSADAKEKDRSTNGAAAAGTKAKRAKAKQSAPAEQKGNWWWPF